MDTVKILSLAPKTLTEKIRGLSIVFFAQILQLSAFVTENIDSTDQFVLIIPAAAVDVLLGDIIYHFQQVRQIYVFYENDIDLERDKKRIENKDGKLRFCHKRNLDGLIERLQADAAINLSQSNGHPTIDHVTSSSEARILAKQQNVATGRSSAEKRIVSSSKRGVLVRNIDQMNAHYICSSCKLMFRDPHQMECGHRICKSCIKTENNQTICSTCFHPSSNQFIWRDHGFHREIRSVPVSCFTCDWNGDFQTYLEHIDEKHRKEEDKSTVRDVYIQQTQRSRLHGPECTAEAGEQILSDIRSTSRSTSMPDSSHTVNTPDQILFNHMHEMIDALSNRVTIISHDQKRIAARIQSSSQSLDHNFFAIRAFHEDILSLTNQLRLRQDLYAQEISSLQQAIGNAALTCYDGVYTWKITGVRDKLVDAQSERQRSIYSPVFYSSGNGYKLRLRLYLNGDADTRDKHISLFLVIMKNEYDAILLWPFPYKVSLGLINQSAPNNASGHIVHCISPDASSSSFQRPISDMNEAYGVKEFLSIELFEQKRDLYIQDDTMFIKANIDFLSQNLPYPTFTGGSPNDEEHVGSIDDGWMQLS